MFASNILVGSTDSDADDPGGYVYSTRWQSADDTGSAALNGVGTDGKLSAFLAIDRSSADKGEVARVGYDGSATFTGTVTAANITAFKSRLNTDIASATDLAAVKQAIIDALADL